MSDDHSNSSQNRQSWLEKLSQAFAVDPETKEDILEILRAAQRRDIIDEDALSLIEGAMQVTDMQVREIMVPRAQMVIVNISEPPADFLAKIFESAHSRFPVIDDDPDDVIGILLAKDLLGLMLHGNLNKDKILDILRPATFVPESKRLNHLLKEFRSTRNHMAIVVDEYGGVAGLVTIEDVLEQIVGEIEDEHDIDDEGLIKPRGAEEYAVKALTPIEEFNEFFQSDMDDTEFDTIGGLVLKRFGRLPKRGEAVDFGGFRFKVLNADNRQVRLLQVTRI